MKKTILSASILAALTLTGCNSSDNSSDSSITAPTIKPVNSIPVAKHDVTLVGQFNRSQNLVIDALANDSDADNDNLIIIEAKAAYGDVLIESNSLVYRGIEKTPSDRDAISYTIEDSNGASASSSVSVFAAPDNDSGFGQDTNEIQLTWDLANVKELASGLYELAAIPAFDASWKIKEVKAVYGEVTITPSNTILYQVDAGHAQKDSMMVLAGNGKIARLYSYGIYDSRLGLEKPNELEIPPREINPTVVPWGVSSTGENLYQFMYDDKASLSKFRIDTICQKLPSPSDSDCDILIPRKKTSKGFVLSASQMANGSTISVESGVRGANSTIAPAVVESNKLTVGTEFTVTRTIDTTAVAKPMHDAMEEAAKGSPAVEEVFKSVFNDDGSLVDDVKFETYGSTSIIRAENHLSGAPRNPYDGVDYQKVTVMTPSGDVKVFTGDNFVVSKDGSTMVYLSGLIDVGGEVTSRVALIDLNSDNLEFRLISGTDSIVFAAVDTYGNYIPQGSFDRNEIKVSFEATSRLHISDDGKYVAYFLADIHGKSIDIHGWAKGATRYKPTTYFKGAQSNAPSSFKANYLYGATISEGKLYIHSTSKSEHSIVANLNDGSFEATMPPTSEGGAITDSNFFDSENAVYKFDGANNRPSCGHPSSSDSGREYVLANKNDSSVVNIPAAAGYPMLGDSKVAIMDVGVPYGSNVGSSKSEDDFLGVKIYSYEGKELSRYPIDGLACYANDSGCDKGIPQTDIKAYPVSFAAEGNGFRVTTSSEPSGKGKINTYLFN